VRVVLNRLSRFLAFTWRGRIIIAAFAIICALLPFLIRRIGSHQFQAGGELPELRPIYLLSILIVLVAAARHSVKAAINVILRLAVLIYGPENVANALNNIAGMLRNSVLGERLVRRALAISETYCGSNHESVALSLNNIAVLYYATRRFAEAEPLFRRALVIRESCFALDDLVVAKSVNNLAMTLADLRRFEEAEPLFRRALAIFEDQMLPDNPVIASILNNIANLLSDTGRFAEAEPLFQRALAIYEGNYGPKHRTVLVTLNNIANNSATPRGDPQQGVSFLER
jgi:tetratricopeptide (TPR) repeat protein